MIIKKLKEILNSDKTLKIRTEDGKLMDLEKNMKVEKGEIVEIDPKEQLYVYLFGKKKINKDDLRELNETFNEVKQFILNNSSYSTRKKYKELLDVENKK